jgi:hypothetical protein
VREIYASCVKARSASAERSNLRQAADDREILQEMSYLVGIGELIVEYDCRDQGKDGDD